MVRRMMTDVKIRRMIRGLYQKNLSPEEREET